MKIPYFPEVAYALGVLFAELEKMTKGKFSTVRLKVEKIPSIIFGGGAEQYKNFAFLTANSWHDFVFKEIAPYLV